MTSSAGAGDREVRGGRGKKVPKPAILGREWLRAQSMPVLWRGSKQRSKKKNGGGGGGGGREVDALKAPKGEKKKKKEGGVQGAPRYIFKTRASLAEKKAHNGKKKKKGALTYGMGCKKTDTHGAVANNFVLGEKVSNTAAGWKQEKGGGRFSFQKILKPGKRGGPISLKSQVA